MSSLFHASRLKIERAKQHVNDLYDRIIAFQTSDFYTVVSDTDAQPGNDVFHYRETKPFPSDELSLVIGDALHNLKGALDLAINTVNFARLKRYDDFARFPVRETRNDLINTINGGLIHKASEAITRFIVDSVKPYKGGNDALWALHKLNILDKHRLLLPIFQVSAILDLRLEDERGEPILGGVWAFTGGRQTTLNPFPQHRNVKVTDKGKANVLVHFEKGFPMEGHPIPPFLVNLTHVVTGVIDDMEKIFLAE